MMCPSFALFAALRDSRFSTLTLAKAQRTPRYKRHPGIYLRDCGNPEHSEQYEIASSFLLAMTANEWGC